MSNEQTLTREERIALAVRECPGCGSDGFPRLDDCEACTNAIDWMMAQEAKARAAPPPEPPLPWLALDLEQIFQWALSKVDQDMPGDKPEMPAHDYALQWAFDTASGPSIRPAYPWGERNLALCYRDYHVRNATLTAQLAEARELIGRQLKWSADTMWARDAAALLAALNGGE